MGDAERRADDGLVDGRSRTIATAPAPAAALQPALDFVAAAAERLVADTIDIATIPAPTFEEAARAAYVRARLERLGLDDVRSDDVGNVLATRPGADVGQ